MFIFTHTKKILKTESKQNVYIQLTKLSQLIAKHRRFEAFTDVKILIVAFCVKMPYCLKGGDY